MIDKFLKLILLLSPIAYTTKIELDLFDALFFRFSAVILFCLSLLEKPKRNINIGKPASLLMALCAFNLCVNNFNPIIISSTLNVFFGLVILNTIINYAGSIKSYYSWIASSVAITTIVFIFQRFGYNPILSTNLSGKEGGLMGNAPRLLAYLGLVFPILFSMLPLVSVILLIVIAISVKELTILLPLFIYLFIVNRKTQRILLVGIFISTIILFREHIIQSLLSIRWVVWKPTIDAIFQRPLLGYGLGTFSALSKFVGSKYQVDYVFNDYIQLAFSFGLLGIVFVGYYMKKFFLSLNNNIVETLSLISFFIFMLLEYPLEIPRLWITLIAILGFYIIKKGELNAC